VPLERLQDEDEAGPLMFVGPRLAVAERAAIDGLRAARSSLSYTVGLLGGRVIFEVVV
jgi:hypothetical protein